VTQRSTNVHRYREYELFSEADELLRRAFRDGFKRLGLTFPQFMEALAWYRDRVRPGAEEASLVEGFSEFAAEQGWRQDHRDAVLDIYRSIRDAGPNAAMAATPQPDEDRATLARGDALLRSDPARYWGDAELQDALFEARERLGAAAPPRETEQHSAADAADRLRVEEIEALLRDRSGAGQQRYWSDAGLRTDYAQALARLHPDSADAVAKSSPVAPAGSSDEQPSAISVTA
jgi:hypothetical protein